MPHNTCIIACETLKDELNAVMRKLNSTLPVVWLDSGAHAQPEKLREKVQAAIDSLPDNYTTVLLLFGFCGNTMVGIKSEKRTLVLPVTADCIPLFLGSCEKREACGTDTYFFTKGYFDSPGSIVSETQRVMEHYGAEEGLAIMKEILKSYCSFTVIDTGAFNSIDLLNKVKGYAKLFDIPVKMIRGSLRLIELLVSGDWLPEDFLIKKPGETITLEDALCAGKTHQALTQITASPIIGN